MSTSGDHMTLLFDGECPLCQREARWLARRDRHRRLHFLDIADPDFDPTSHGLTRPQVMARMHAVLPDGSVIQGMEVFRRAYRAVGLGWMLAPTAWPLLRPLADVAYTLFARHRVRIGNILGRGCADGSCSMPLPNHRAAAPTPSNARAS